MNLALAAYSGLLRAVVAFLDCFPPPPRLDAEEIPLRKGLCEPFEDEGLDCIWVHGASLGEVITLRPFLKALASRFGKERILCTATTMDGLRRLRSDEIVGRCTLLPVEIPEFLGPFLDRMKPSLALFSETEIWPMTLALLRGRNIPYGIVNGRINPRTVKIINLLKPLFREAIEGISFVFPQTEEYSKRFASIGVPGFRLEPLGCFKFDLIEPAAHPDSLLKHFGFPSDRKIICFGSTHPGEEEIIFEALKEHLGRPDLLVILAPRHLNRLAEIENLLLEKKIPFSRLTHPANPVPGLILVDTLGDLKNLYAVSSLAFVGGSLIPRGGHNLLEPAAHAIPVLSGPHTANFPIETAALKNENALHVVKDAASMRDFLNKFLKTPGAFMESGKRARGVLQSFAGTVGRTLAALEKRDLLPRWPRQ